MAEQSGELDINVRRWMTFSQALEDFNPAPYAVEVRDRQGEEGGYPSCIEDIFVVDATYNRLIKYECADFDNPQYFPAEFGTPAEKLDINENLNIAVQDSGTIDPSILAYARTETDRRLLKPLGVAVGPNFIYVADAGHGRVLALKEDPEKGLIFSHTFGFFKNTSFKSSIPSG